MKNSAGDPGLDKKLVRQKISLTLQQLSDSDYAEFNGKVSHRFFNLDIVLQANIVMIYYSIAREVETVTLIAELLRRGKRVGLPVCREDLNLDVREIASLDQVRQRNFKRVSLFEPKREAPLICPEDLDLIVIPGLAFDLAGNRLGHGAGYYDRFLHNIPCRIFKLGLAYDLQVKPELPASIYDVPVDGLLTVKNYYDFRL